MYSSKLFSKEKKTNWEDKAYADKIWATCEKYFKDIYVKQKIYKKATRGN